MRAQPLLGLFDRSDDSGRSVYINRSFVMSVESEFNGTSVNSNRCRVLLADGTIYELNHPCAVIARWAANLEAQ